MAGTFSLNILQKLDYCFTTTKIFFLLQYYNVWQILKADSFL